MPQHEIDVGIKLKLRVFLILALDVGEWLALCCSNVNHGDRVYRQKAEWVLGLFWFLR
jgi:hypothetical protein